MFEKRRLLAVMPNSTNYLSSYTVRTAASFEEAKQMIIEAESAYKPFDDLDLPVYDETTFWRFVDWMENTNRKYSFSIFGCKDTEHFIKIRDIARERGFHFNS